jgi:mycofactocin precursor
VDHGKGRRVRKYDSAMENEQSVDGSTETADSEIEEELLIEEISIDGMCGVY